MREVTDMMTITFILVMAAAALLPGAIVRATLGALR
jgi:hypothetical protein